MRWFFKGKPALLMISAKRHSKTPSPEKKKGEVDEKRTHREDKEVEDDDDDDETR